MSELLQSKIKFKDLCLLFEDIAKSKGAQKLLALQKFTRKYNAYASKFKAEHPDEDTSLYPIYRLILPSLERERGPYGLRTKNLRSLYVRVFCLGKNSDSTRRLSNYKNPQNAIGKVEDFAEQVVQLVNFRLQSNEKSSLTILEVNKFLDNVAESHKNSEQSKEEVFRSFMKKISEIELKWLTRLLLKDLKLGLSQRKAFEALHPRAEELFNVTSDLRRVCESFAGSDQQGAEPSIEVTLFSHVKPMLLERFRIEQAARLFVDGEQFYVQVKYDGERSQLHFKDGRFKYFTRQGYDITGNHSYGETAESGQFLTTEIANLLSPTCRSAILDGELMGWHKERRSFGSKGVNYDVKKLGADSKHQPCFVAYDILLYNDELLLEQPYFQRLKRLEAAFTEKTGVLMLCKNSLVSKVDQLVKIFREAVENDDEGIVIKRRDGFYKPNVREKSGCFKIKAEYSDGLVQDLDLLIMGGYYGEGRHIGMLNSFLVGVAHEPTNKNGLPSEFSAVVRVSSGLSDDDLRLIQKRYKPHFTDRKPAGMNAPRSEPPDLWISAKNSLVLKLRATEIIKSAGYPLGYCLRFPRVLEVRLDKPWYDTCKKSEFMSLIKGRGAVQKLTIKRELKPDIVDALSDDEEEERRPTKIRKTRVATSTCTATVHKDFVVDRTLEVTRVSRLFDGKEFNVINGNAELSAQEISVIIKEHMGKVVSNPGENTFCVIVGDPETLRAKTKISSKKYDIASVSWLKRATKQENLGKIQEFYPWELYSMRPATERRLAELYDQYWDHHEEDVDEEAFERAMKKAEELEAKDDEVPVSKMKELDKLIFEDEVSPLSVFRGIAGLFHDKDDVEKYYFTAMCGKVEEELNAGINYIFLNDEVSTDLLKDYEIKLKNLNCEKSILVLKSQWINDCFTSQKLISTEKYIVIL